MNRRQRWLFPFSLFPLLVLPFSVHGQTMTHAWSQRFGDASEQRTVSVALDGMGNVVVAGYFLGTVNIGGGVLTSAGLEDVFVIKFDALGNVIWSRSFGDGGSEYPLDVAVDAAGNVLLIGDFELTIDFGGGVLTSAGDYDVFLAKFDAAGNQLWSQRFGDALTQNSEAVAVDGAGNVLATGEFSGTMDFGGGPLTSAGGTDIFLAKFDPAGTHVWSQRFGDANNQFPRCVESGEADNILLAGRFSGAVDFGGGARTSVGGYDAFLVKFDASGAHIWSQGFGDASTQGADGVTEDGAGNVLLVGSFQGSMDFGGGPLFSAGSNDICVAKFDPSGVHIWSQRFGDVNNQVARGIAVDGADRIFIAAHYQGAVDFGGGVLTSLGSWDAAIAKLDADGGYLWGQRFGDANAQFAEGVAADGAGNVVLAGDFQGTVDFGGGVLTSVGSYDAFLAKFWRAAPEISNVRDVPGDQGGLVNVSFYGSGADTPVEHQITRYTVWRAISPQQAAAMVAAGATLATRPTAVGITATSKPIIRSEQVNGASYFWTLMTSLDAYYLSGYAAQVPTLFDSTAASSEMHYFQVIAHTSNPYVFYTSLPDSGYSVDNLAPGAPQGLVATQAGPASLVLVWERNAEADFSHYAVYRGTAPDFNPGPGNLVATSADTTLTDGDWYWNGGYYYKVSALDVHGNESAPAVLAPENVTGAGNGSLPVRTHLEQNYPNPFNPTTRIVFTLRKAGIVSLRVYDARGQLVRVLVEGWRETRRYEVPWDGRDDEGRAVASGVYFYRLVAGDETFTRKAVLLK